MQAMQFVIPTLKHLRKGEVNFSPYPNQKLIWTAIWFKIQVINSFFEQTPDGGYITCGGSGDEYSYSESGHPSGPSDEWKVFLAKTDSDGNILWQSILNRALEIMLVNNWDWLMMAGILFSWILIPMKSLHRIILVFWKLSRTQLQSLQTFKPSLVPI